MRAAEWTEAHRREALRRTYEIAGEVSAGRDMSLYLDDADRLCESQGGAIGILVRLGLDAARIGREVRRVRGLAEGRLVRETVWRGESGAEYGTRVEAEQDKSHGGGVLTRVTRIRRAI